MSDFTSKDHKGLLEAYYSIYNKKEGVVEELNESVEETLTEDYDVNILLENVKDYLVLCGYVDTEDQACNIMPHMTEEFFGKLIGEMHVIGTCINTKEYLISEGCEVEDYTIEDMLNLFEYYEKENINEAVFTGTAAATSPLWLPAAAAAIGGLGMYLAGVSGGNITGVTLSTEQHKVSNERARAAGLQDRVKFHLQDYRDLPQKFDRIVSVGMFEHVGKKNYTEFFTKLRDLLTDDGVAVIHSIGRLDSPSAINPFIRKYIFPGADVPALSEVTPVVEQSGLLCTDIEILRLHYAETLRHWREAFEARRDEVAAIYDERFCRMWDLYLGICEMGFRYENLMVFQIQLSKSLDAVPLTRDYMFDWERAQAEKEKAGARDKAA